MLVFDELKKNDPQLRLVAMVLAGGLCILLVGLWWVQVVSVHAYQSHLETQAYRTIRIPAMRGKILDREGRVLAENQASYNLNLYLDDLRTQFAAASDQLMKQALTARKLAIAAREKKLGRNLTKAELKQFAITNGDQIRMQARVEVAANVVSEISRETGMPLPFDPEKFARHYNAQLAMPYTIEKDLTTDQIARFEENYTSKLGADLELQSVRYYPNGSVAAHLLGYLQKDDNSSDGEFNYRLPDYRGVAGVEAGYNSALKGTAGEESVLVNNLGYRQSEDVGSEPEPGHNVVLTMDLDIQRAAQESLLRLQGPNANAAAVVMDVHSGDVLALVSSPTFDPNDFVNGISSEKWQQIQTSDAEKNRATYENYAPGSIFKTVVALAALEDGLNPHQIYYVEPNPAKPTRGCIYVGKRKIEDTAPPGDYDFQKAFIHSSNAYFITNGLRTGIANILRIGHEFHLGESTQLIPRQETAGSFPTLSRVNESSWRAGDTANLCIGQGEIAVTPIQMAVMVSALANGGTVLWPRLVDRIEPQDLSSGEPVTNYPAGVVRDHLTVHQRSLQILREAMLADVESGEGSGRAAEVDGLQICGKTGTAQVQDSANRLIGHNYWFASFAPYQNPKYAVVVMVQSPVEGGSGGTICGPVAHDIYEEILKKQSVGAPKILAAENP